MDAKHLRIDERGGLRLIEFFQLTLLSLLLLGVSWLVSAIVFLRCRFDREPPVLTLFCGAAVQIWAECYLSHSSHRVRKAVTIGLFQLMAHASLPTVGGRYLSSAEELMSLRFPFFGAVTMTLCGGCLGGILYAAWSRVPIGLPRCFKNKRKKASLFAEQVDSTAIRPETTDGRGSVV